MPVHKHEIRIATWNVLSLYRAGALARLSDELLRYRIVIAALQEIRWRDSDILNTKEYTIFYSGNNSNTLETGFEVKREAVNAIIGFKPVNERLCCIRIRGKVFNITLICAHAPTEDTDENIKETFYETLERVFDEAPRHDTKIVLGDFNAKIGKEIVYRPTIGKERAMTTECDL